MCKLLERIEEMDPGLLDFVQRLPGMPIYLSGKKEAVIRAEERLRRLGIGTRSTVPTYRDTAIDPANFFTEIAGEIHSRIRNYRDYFRANRKRKHALSLPPSFAALTMECFEEIWPPPKGCSTCRTLDDLSAQNWREWWKYGEKVLADLWKDESVFYQCCIDLDSVAGEAKDSRESVRRNYAKKKIRQAFESIAKNISVPPSLV
jgi:hypothetical protein